MDKRFFACIGIIFAFAVLAFLAYNNLEIYQREKYIYPSREVSANSYHAMEQWLKETGINIRVDSYFYPYMLTESAQKVVMVNSRTLGFFDEKEIIHWIEQGGFLILNLDLNEDNYNDDLEEFISGFGISVHFTQRSTAIKEIPEEDGIEFQFENKNGSNDEHYPSVELRLENYASFQSRIHFQIDSEKNYYVIEDAYGLIRLVEIPVGNGSLTVTGMPVFMFNNNLKREINAKLAWGLTGARISSYNEKREADTDILFIRPLSGRTDSNSFFGEIIERGNFFPVIISIIILIITGFWMVIPGFGHVFEEQKKTSRPIRDRFRAEISFLKKHHALNYYLDVYRREIKNDSVYKNDEVYSKKEIINAIKKAHDKAMNEYKNRLSKIN